MDKVIPNPPDFEWGMDVQEIEHPEVCGIIDELFWHHKRNKFLYYITINGKRKSRRYSDKELRRKNI